ncbi:MAG: hypothetical protein HYV75_11530 [Opitutae bacterium]|nr:hypothetical protein [Opitutae bacterium]
MKTKSLLLLAALLCTAGLLHAAKSAAGPSGGRVLSTEPLAVEFFVTPDRKVELTFLDPAGKPAAPGAQAAAVTAEPATGKVALPLERSPHGFVSTTALPAGEPYRVVVQLRAAPGAKPQNFRLDLALSTCGECRHAEYACTCEGH